MKRFKIGDRVISLTDSLNERSQPRKKGCIYPVLDVVYCEKCGNQSINITGANIIAGVECKCGNIRHNRGKWWTTSEYFALIDESSLEEAVSAENYELAVIIRDNLK